MKSQEIESILQFIYLGQATFYQDRMNEFLNVAKSLEIKELSKNLDDPKIEELGNFETQDIEEVNKDSQTISEESKMEKKMQIESKDVNGTLFEYQSVHQSVHVCKEC